MTILTVAALAALLTWIGDRTLLAVASSSATEPLEIRAVAGSMAGAVLLYLVAFVLDAAGASWSRATILGSLGMAGVALHYATRSRSGGEQTLRLRALDLLWPLALLPFAYCALSGWSLSPDFVYHWGLKAQRLFLHGGVDWDWLGSGAHPGLHPDYPNLVPILGAVTATLRGVFRATAGTLWSVVWAFALVGLGRGWLRREGASARLVGWGTVSIALFLGFGAIAFRRAGDADWHLAVAILAGAVLLTSKRTSWVEGGLGATAAFAAASKIEGLPFTAFLVGLALLTGGREKATVASILRLGAPVLLVGSSWLWSVHRFELFQPSNLGPPRFDQLPRIAEALAASVTAPEWRGMALLLVALLPLPWLSRRYRVVGALVALQLGFYLFAYVATPLDPALLVSTSFFRLAAHLAPTIVLAAILVADQRSGREMETALPE